MKAEPRLAAKLELCRNILQAHLNRMAKERLACLEAEHGVPFGENRFERQDKLCYTCEGCNREMFRNNQLAMEAYLDWWTCRIAYHEQFGSGKR